MTYDASALILYKDGEEVARVDATGTLQQNDLSLSIGGRLSSGQNYLGTIDDVRLFNRTLTPEEVNEDRLKFAASLSEEAGHDLKKLGLMLDTLKIQNVQEKS